MAARATLPALLSSLTQSLNSALEATPQPAAIEPPKDGISLLDVKNELLLSYLHNLVFLILIKLRNSKGDESDDVQDTGLDDSVRAKLVELRLFLEKGARPLEEKLRFSIERFLRTAEDAQREKKVSEKSKGHGSNDDDSEASSAEEDSDEDDESADEARPSRRSNMAAAPNLGTMRDDVTARPSLLNDRGSDGPAGIYRPPKRDRAVMADPSTSAASKPTRRPNKSHTMEEFIASELASAPAAEPSVGTTIVRGGRAMKTAAQRAQESERRDYEESNFVRLPQESKKDKAKRAKSEGMGRNGRMQFGGEEWHDLGEGVDRIDRLTKRKEGGRGSNVKALLDKSRKRGIDTTDGPRSSGHGAEIGDRFNKRVKVLESGRRDRGKKR